MRRSSTTTTPRSVLLRMRRPKPCLKRSTAWGRAYSLKGSSNWAERAAKMAAGGVVAAPGGGGGGKGGGPPPLARPAQLDQRLLEGGRIVAVVRFGQVGG